METFSLSDWAKRRALSEIGAALQSAANFVPLPIVVTTGTGKLVKGTLVGLVFTFPERPGFGQIEGIPQTFGLVLDYHERAIRGFDSLDTKDREWVMELDRLLLQNEGGTVTVMPAFYGQDP